MTVQVFWSDPGQPKPRLFSAFTSRGRIWWLPVDRPPYRRTSPPTKRELRHRYKSHRQDSAEGLVVSNVVVIILWNNGRFPVYLHFQYSYECLHVQFTWWLLMTTDKFVQDGIGLSRRLSCSFDLHARRPVWERAGCLPGLDLARFWHYTLYSMKQTVVIAGGIAVHTFFLCLCIVHCVPVCIKWKEIDDWMKYA